MNVTVVAVANGEPSQPYLVRGFNAFRDSCRRHGCEPLILGWAAPWRGLGSKPKLLKKAIDDGTIKTEYLIFADAFDTCFAQSPEIVLDSFQRLRAKLDSRPQIIWNGERNCFPRAHWADHHPLTPHPYRFFNSGLSVGATEAYHAMLSQLNLETRPDDHQRKDGSWHHENDQDYLMEKFLFGQCGADEPAMAIDSGAEIFQTMVEESMDHFQLLEGGMVLNALTSTVPQAFHWNGGAKSNGTMEPILQHLGL